jgi:YfiH family protein
MILRVAAWETLDWLEHGFGTRLSEGWTERPGRATVRQVHSDAVRIVSEAGDAGPGDALVSDTAGLLLEVRTADCIPILLVDPVRKAVAAVHAGWRGTEAQIAAKAVSTLRDRFGCRDLQAAIGPGIQVCCFEVGPEVALRFGLASQARIDLIEHNREQLRAEGVGEIVRVGECTRCAADVYHSYRRDGLLAGRMASAIGIRVEGKEKRREPQPAP